MSQKLGVLILLFGGVLGVCGSALASTTATITVNGSEVSGDTSTITVAFNGFTESVRYGQYSTQASVASALAGMFARDYVQAGLSAQVLCGGSQSVVTFALQGAGTFGTLGVTGSTNSFQLTSSGFTSQSQAETPTISSLSPTSGVVGASVNITGTNFGASQGTSVVSFNGTTATVSSWSATSISVIVPSAATTGNVVATVNGVASNGMAFTVLQSSSPSSSSVSYIYDSQGRLYQARYTTSSGIITVTYSYDSDGNRTSVVTQ